MSYQFIHIEDYGRVVSKKTKNNGSNDKYKKVYIQEIITHLNYS